ncbi:Cytochrome P450 [Melia azedarach]|uniref:Cytochrome P450 n=1 Tax=Melia azedarach TaxID=155640 RepID=A0ACC1X441_MELAZ|nr:Cytochrome P450 [Melia azedarach]
MQELLAAVSDSTSSTVESAFGRTDEESRSQEQDLYGTGTRTLNLEYYKGNDFEYLPFGSGRKICTGMTQAAVRQIQLVLAAFIQQFDWCLPNAMLPNERDMNEKFGVRLMQLEPLVLITKLSK